MRLRRVTGRPFSGCAKSVEQIISDGEAARLVRGAPVEWYRELFQPCVRRRSDSAGGACPVTGSKCRLHARPRANVPPRWEVRARCNAGSVRSAGAGAGTLRARGARALALGYIHPTRTATGRMGDGFVMNAMLASAAISGPSSGAGPGCVFSRRWSARSVRSDIEPFATGLLPSACPGGRWSRRREVADDRPGWRGMGLNLSEREEVRSARVRE